VVSRTQSARGRGNMCIQGVTHRCSYNVVFNNTATP
jgi:hypothetical protein